MSFKNEKGLERNGIVAGVTLCKNGKYYFSKSWKKPEERGIFFLNTVIIPKNLNARVCVLGKDKKALEPFYQNNQNEFFSAKGRIKVEIKGSCYLIVQRWQEPKRVKVKIEKKDLNPTMRLALKKANLTN
ncbi:MAG: hypothetical protein GF387_01460 [Candidatus Portnoybacteria bacterium]|nr:hypothetical protein [Candidatus Portnoybacteria bacterium]